MEKLCLKKNLALESFFNVNLVRLEHRLFYLSCEVVQIILISSAIIIPIRYFLIQPFCQRASMEPNFYDQEYLIIDELTWRTRAPVRGRLSFFVIHVIRVSISSNA